MTTIAMNLSNQAITQYTGYDYNSMGKLGDTPIGFTNIGVDKLEQKVHDGVEINAWFKTGYLDFELPNQKRIRNVILGGEAENDLQMTVNCNEDSQVPVYITFSKNSLKLSGAKAYSQRTQKGMFYQFKIANTSGAKFSVESLNATVMVLHTKPRGV